MHAQQMRVFKVVLLAENGDLLSDVLIPAKYEVLDVIEYEGRFFYRHDSTGSVFKEVKGVPAICKAGEAN